MPGRQLLKCCYGAMIPRIGTAGCINDKNGFVTDVVVHLATAFGIFCPRPPKLFCLLKAYVLMYQMYRLGTWRFSI